MHFLRSLPIIARLIAVALLLSLGGALPSNIAASYAEWCCGDCGDDEGDCSDEGERGEERGGDCDCPLDCTACCSASLARAVAPDAPASLAPPLLDSAFETLSIFARPPQGVSRDILHVPKLAA